MDKNLLLEWNAATANLPWGVQAVLHNAVELVAEDKITLVHSADYSNGSPCLINSVGQMLTVGGGQGIPSASFGPIVRLWDTINREFTSQNVNKDDHLVSPLAGEILLQHFADLKEKPIEAAVNEAMATESFANNIYVEPKDEDVMREWVNSLEHDAVCEPALQEQAPTNENETVSVKRLV